MIIPITGNVTYPITLDPTAWIFDDRKIILEQAFTDNKNSTVNQEEIKKAAERWERAIYQMPPVDAKVSRKESNEFLKNSYVIPIKDFLNNAKSKDDAATAVLNTPQKNISIALDDLKNGLFLFFVDGKPLDEDGPVHFIYQDGSNRNQPIKSIQKIVIQ